MQEPRADREVAAGVRGGGVLQRGEQGQPAGDGREPCAPRLGMNTADSDPAGRVVRAEALPGLEPRRADRCRHGVARHRRAQRTGGRTAAAPPAPAAAPRRLLRAAPPVRSTRPSPARPFQGSGARWEPAREAGGVAGAPAAGGPSLCSGRVPCRRRSGRVGPPPGRPRRPVPSAAGARSAVRSLRVRGCGGAGMNIRTYAAVAQNAWAWFGLSGFVPAPRRRSRRTGGRIACAARGVGHTRARARVIAGRSAECRAPPSPASRQRASVQQ